MDAWFIHFLGHPVVLTGLLFLAPFVLEEAAILSGAGLAAAGELPALVALIALYAGTVVSDWALYALGAAAGRSARVRSWIPENYIRHGHDILHRGVLGAALVARLVPWLLFPVFVASGFLSVGFARFAAVNAVIAFVYVNVLYWSIYGLDLLLFEIFDEWGWVAVLVLIVVVIAISRRVSRRYRDSKVPNPDPGPPDCR